MPNQHDGERVKVICSDCGSQYELSYRRRADIIRENPDNPKFRCKSCYKYWRKHVWYSELPEEEREAYSAKRSNLSKGVWANMDEDKKALTNLKKANTRISHSEEEKAITREKVQSTWRSKSKEEMEAHSEVRRANTQAFWDSLDDKGREEMSQKMSDAQRNYLDNLSDREREIIKRNKTEANWRYWANLTEEQRKQVWENRSIAQKKQWSEKSADQRENIRQKIVEASLRRWRSYTDEEKKEYGERHKREFWDNMTPEKFEEWEAKKLAGMTDVKLNTLEMKFANALAELNLRYEFRWVNKATADGFEDKFSKNPLSNTVRVSPFHVWDFFIESKNGAPILVDVDGSIHDREATHHMGWKNSSGVDVSLADYIEFNDSKRPYQTDGLTAYAIKALNDEITDTTEVVNVKTNKTMSYRQFQSILQFMTMTDEELEELKKSHF